MSDTNQRLAAKTFCTPETGVVKKGEPIPAHANFDLLRRHGFVEEPAPAPRAAKHTQAAD